jgi:hypothetical protein
MTGAVCPNGVSKEIVGRRKQGTINLRYGTLKIVIEIRMGRPYEMKKRQVLLFLSQPFDALHG